MDFLNGWSVQHERRTIVVSDCDKVVFDDEYLVSRKIGLRFVVQFSILFDHCHKLY